MDEFELIRHYFAVQQAQPDVVVGIGDDGAVLQPRPDKQQVQVIDTLVEGVHFLVATDPADIAYRAVAVNLSDIAAMGATPRWMTLALATPHGDAKWVAAFAGGIFELAKQHDLALVGGDTTRAQQVVVTVSISGEVDAGAALLRSGAQVGDTIFITGTVGDAAAGLKLLRQGQQDDFLTRRFLRPTPRVAIGRRLAGIASAAIDVSDGLIGDLGKLLSASGVGANLQIEKLPLSAALRRSFDEQQCIEFALSGGDDYELCFSARAEDVGHIQGITAIGEVTAESRLLCTMHGDVVSINDSGYRHFDD